MAGRRKVRLWVGVALGLVLVAGTLVGVVALSFREAPRRTLVFPDGSRLTVLGASLYGQPFTTDKPWQATLRRWLPAKWPGWLPARWQGWLPTPVTFPATPILPASPPGVTNSLSVWFAWVGPGGSNSSSFTSGFFVVNTPNTPPCSWAAAVSDKGFRFGAERVDYGSIAAGGAAVGGSGVSRIQLAAFPRRQREFELQLLDAGMKVLGSVTVPNPARRAFPEWKAEPLPIVRTNGSLVVTLLSVAEDDTHGNGRARSDEPAQIRLETSPEAGIAWTYRLSSADPEWRQATLPLWRVQSSDATGNTTGPLDYGEKAWKLFLEFRRPIATHFSEEEGFVVSGLEIPKPGTRQVLTNEFERLGMKFKLRWLAGAGVLDITNSESLWLAFSGVSPFIAGANSNRLAGEAGKSYWTDNSSGSGPARKVTASRPSFLIEVSGISSQDQVRFRVFESSGRELLPPVSTFPTVEKRSYLVAFDATNATGTVSLEVGINRPRTVEFFVSPAEVKRAGN